MSSGPPGTISINSINSVAADGTLTPPANPLWNGVNSAQNQLIAGTTTMNTVITVTILSNQVFVWSGVATQTVPPPGFAIPWTCTVPAGTMAGASSYTIQAQDANKQVTANQPITTT